MAIDWKDRHDRLVRELSRTARELALAQASNHDLAGQLLDAQETIRSFTDRTVKMQRHLGNALNELAQLRKNVPEYVTLPWVALAPKSYPLCPDPQDFATEQDYRLALAKWDHDVALWEAEQAALVLADKGIEASHAYQREACRSREARSRIMAEWGVVRAGDGLSENTKLVVGTDWGDGATWDQALAMFSDLREAS